MKRWLWLAPVALVWPALHLAVFALRFGRLPLGGPLEGLVFLPMGAVSGLVLLVLLQVSRSRRQAALTVAGYALAAPLAFLGSLLGGLALNPLPGTIIMGALPLVLGAATGYLLGAPRRA